MLPEVPGYQIEETLFNSQRTAIHRAIREADGKPVILKQLVASFPQIGQTSRFFFGYEILTKFDHPNIIKPLDWIAPNEREASVPTMVLEDRQSIDLFRYIKSFENGFLPVEGFLNIALQLAEALSVIHYHQIIHKDLHPGNILVNPDSGLTQITDFGLASLLSREQPSLKTPDQLEGVLAYMSPEQTGRMNRALDYRTDFYTLGATFYHALSGNPPFTSEDALGMVHAHIAKPHKPLIEVRTDIPPMLSAVIDRLLTKVAEERYQSALGLKRDIEKVLNVIRSNKPEATFALGLEDIADRFQVPQKLHGREYEVSQLMRSFLKSAGGKPCMLAISGYSGIGKSALVHEVHKPIAAYNGLFCAGKFDQFQKNVPYSALQTALKVWIQHTLAYTEKRLNARRRQLNEALGANARVLIDFMPDFALVLGELSPVAVLGADETQNRFHLVFQQFIRLISKNQPLVLFIDDIQWADRGTLNLLPFLLNEVGSRILIIVAYRDNEVDESHRVYQTLKRIRTSVTESGELVELNLGSLNAEHVSSILQDATHRPQSELESLSQLVLAKTAGNPFFVGEFLKTLYIDRLLDFNLRRRRWVWDLGRIKEKNITDNVVDLMLERMRRLPLETQSLLQLAACMGSRFDLIMLTYISEKKPEIVAKHLWPALHEGLLLQDVGDWHSGFVNHSQNQGSAEANEHSKVSSLSPQCRFLHDMMLQAAYNSISEEKRAGVHLNIGRLLYRHYGKELGDKHCFTIVEQYNKAVQLITTNEERELLVQLNLSAAKLAWNASVWDAVANYAAKGIEMLGSQHWSKQYKASEQLFTLKAQAEHLNGNPEVADRYYSELFKRLDDPILMGKLCATRLAQSIGRGQWFQGIEYGKQGLEFLNRVLPNDKNLQLASNKECKELEEQINGGVIDPDRLSEMEDEHSLIVLSLYSNLTLAGMIVGNNHLSLFCNFKGCNHILKNGKSDLAAIQLACYAMYLHRQGNIEQAFKQTELAKLLIESYPPCQEITNFYNIICGSTWYLKAPFSECIALYRKGAEIGFENGEIARAVIGQCTSLIMEVGRGDKLKVVLESAQTALNLLKKNAAFSPPAQIIHNYSTALLTGNQASQSLLDDCAFELDMINRTKATTHFPYLMHMRSWLAFWSENYAESLMKAMDIEAMKERVSLHSYTKDHVFLLALLLIRQECMGAAEQQLFDSCLAQLKLLAEHYPPNFQHKYLLVLAEKARADSLPADQVFPVYRQAIMSAQQNGFLHLQALGIEMYANYWYQKGESEFAELNYNKAIQLYEYWGGKLRSEILRAKMARLFPKLDMASYPYPVQASHLGSYEKQSLDLDSVMKSAQAISSELHLKKLAAKVLEVIIESAGASYGALIHLRHNEFRVQALVNEGEGVEWDHEPPLLDDFDQLPKNVVSLVLHSGKQVNVGNLAEENALTSDPYFGRKLPRSVLCVPVVYREKITGALYLENTYSIDAFTTERMDVINLLLAQSAISLENAELFNAVSQLNENLEAKVEQRTAELAEANEELEAFNRTVSHDLRAPLRGIRSYTELILEDFGHSLDPEVLTYFNKVIHYSGKMKDLIEGLLALSKVQKTALKKQTIDLSAMVMGLFSDMKEHFPDQNAKFVCAEGCVVEADSRMLYSAMENLINNAWKYSSKKDVTEVTFGVADLKTGIPEGPAGHRPDELPENEVVYYLKDNGTGFDLRLAGQLFGTFQRLHSDSEFSGIGVGLSTVKRIFEKHGGYIWANAVQGEGAIFYFTLGDVSMKV